MPVDDCLDGLAIEFELDGVARRAMIAGSNPSAVGEEATHLLEFIGWPTPGQEQWVVLNYSKRHFVDPRSGSVIPFKLRGYHLPPLPDHKEHTCTDVGCLAVFLLALGFLGWITCYAARHGDIHDLHHAFDYNGNMCGVDLPGKKYAYWCMAADQSRLLLRYPICVEECPSSDDGSHLCFDGARNASVPDYATKLFGMSPYCWPREPRLMEQVSEARRMRSAKQPGPMLMALPRRTWIVFPVAGLVAMSIGYAYFRLLEKCVDFIVLTFILFVTNLSLVVGMWQASAGGPGRVLPGVALILLGAAGYCSFASPAVREAISKAAGCIEAACECIHQEPSLLFEPLLATALRGVVLTSLMYVLLLLVTCGEPHRSTSDQVGKEFDFNIEQRVYMAYVVFMICWLMEMSTSLSQYVLAWVTQRWYFTPYVNNKKLDWSRDGVCRAYVNAIHKHLGTLALGSLAIAVCRVPRVICKGIAGLAAAAAGSSSAVGTCAAAMNARLSIVHRSAYLGVALTSERFWRAASSADYMLNSNEEVEAVTHLSGMQGIFQVGGLAVIIAASGACTMMLSNVFGFFGPEAEAKDFVNFLTMAISIPLGIGYMTLFDTVGDTILYCWAVQQRRYKYHISHTAATGNLLSAFTGSQCDDDGTRVNYAPPALRELVLGRHRKLSCLACCAGSQEV